MRSGLGLEKDGISVIIGNMKVPLTVVVITRDEQDRIEDCLASVADWAAEIIVVDDESSDATCQLARKYTDKVLTRRMDIEGRHRNWAYAQASCDWILSLDADERPTPELKAKISEVLADSPACSAFTVQRRNHIGNYWLKWGGQYPAPQIKLIRKDKFKWEEVEVHPRAISEGPCGQIKADLLHFSYKDWSDFLNKLNSQTSWEAKKWHKLSKDNPKKARHKMNWPHAVWRTVDRFIRVFVAKGGWRDGFAGFMLAFFAGLYQMISFAKYWELKRDEGSIS